MGDCICLQVSVWVLDASYIAALCKSPSCSFLCKSLCAVSQATTLHTAVFVDLCVNAPDADLSRVASCCSDEHREHNPRRRVSDLLRHGHGALQLMESPRHQTGVGTLTFSFHGNRTKLKSCDHQVELAQKTRTGSCLTSACSEDGRVFDLRAKRTTNPFAPVVRFGFDPCLMTNRDFQFACHRASSEV